MSEIKKPRLTGSNHLVDNSEAMIGFLSFGQEIQTTQDALRRERPLQQQMFLLKLEITCEHNG